MRPFLSWDEWPDATRAFFQALRSPKGEELILEKSLFIEYLLPRSTNIRRVFVDNSTTPISFWVGSNDGASIVKLEPLD